MSDGVKNFEWPARIAVERVYSIKQSAIETYCIGVQLNQWRLFFWMIFISHGAIKIVTFSSHFYWWMNYILDFVNMNCDLIRAPYVCLSLTTLWLLNSIRRLFSAINGWTVNTYLWFTCKVLWNWVYVSPRFINYIVFKNKHLSSVHNISQ